MYKNQCKTFGALIVLILSFAQITFASTKQGTTSQPPHIVLFVADDLGWGDVGYHGSQIKTPHIDALAKAGTRLNRFYVMPVCSPTRGALLTGRHPIRLGLQCGVVRPWAAHGLPTDERTLPQALRKVGYTTAIVGKWHLGHSQDGLVFTKLFWLIGGRHVDYPHIIEHDGHLLIAFSGAKQTMEVLKVSLDDLDRLEMPKSVELTQHLRAIKRTPQQPPQASRAHKKGP